MAKNIYDDKPMPKAVNKALTIDELYKALAAERKKGNGKKRIMLSADDEGNEFHQCFYAITPITEEFSYAHFGHSMPFKQVMEEFVILG